MPSQWINIETCPIKKRVAEKHNSFRIMPSYAIIGYPSAILIGDPSKGHLRSPGVTNGFLPITGDMK